MFVYMMLFVDMLTLKSLLLWGAATMKLLG
jgi:hypothetical protein